MPAPGSGSGSERKPSACPPPGESGSRKGPAWAWTSWHYDLKMSDGSGTIAGDATITDGNIDTVKDFASPDGIVRMVIKDHIKPVDESQFMDVWRKITSR